MVAVAGYRLDWIRRNRLQAELTRRAPHADVVIVKTAAALIAGSACSDALLIMADALTEASEVLAAPDDRPYERASLRTLAEALREEAPAHAANDLFTRQAPHG